MPREHIFDEAEYERRVARTKERLREQNLDAIVVADPANMNYLTGYDGWSFYVHQAVVVTPDRDEPIWIGRDMDGDGARATTHLSDDSIRAYSDDHVHSPHDLHPMDYVAGVLEELDVADGRIGLEMDAAYFTAKSYMRLQQNLPDAEFEDATLLVGWIRVKKSDQELEYMEQAARISENAMRAGLDAIEEGVPSTRVAAAIYEQLIEGTEEYGGDYPAIVPLMPSGDHTGTPHLTWTDRPFEGGPGHHRTLRLSAPLPLAAGPNDLRRRPAGRAAGDRGHRRRGVGGGARRRGARRQMRERREGVADHHRAVRLEKEDRIGYSMGLGYPPDWGRAHREHPAGRRDRPRRGHDVPHDPGIWTDEIGMEISETFHVTSTGAETLAEFPRELFTA